jgi:hypothetical protein
LGPPVPDHLADAANLLGAARSAEKLEHRVLYAAHARLEIEAAARELDSLRVNLRGIEELGKDGGKNG